jgi:hypothetical protein
VEGDGEIRKDKMGDVRHTVLVRKCKERRLLGRPRHGWKSIKIVHCKVK